jgi:hypothetical protein
VDDPKTFIGAVLTMHQIMLDHTVKLFVSCLRVIMTDIKAREVRTLRLLHFKLIFVVEVSQRRLAG